MGDDLTGNSAITMIETVSSGMAWVITNTPGLVGLDGNVGWMMPPVVDIPEPDMATLAEQLDRWDLL